MTAHPPLAALRNALLSDGRRVDLLLRDGHVDAVREPSARPLREGERDLDGALVLSAGAEPHTHMDKALVFDRLPPEYGGLLAGIRRWQEHAVGLDEADFVDRGLALARRFLRNGVTAVRTHAEIFPSGDPLRCVRGLVRVREMVGEAMDLQIVVLAKNDIDDAVIEAALDLGADVVGGSPHTASAPDAEVDRLLAIARRRDVGIDIHADERLDPASLTVQRLARAIAAEPLAGGAVAGHCVSLALLSPERLDEVAEDLVAGGIHVVAIPQTNLYLQGRESAPPVPRAIAPVRALAARGVRVTAAGDNVRDPLNPLGAADHLATASLLVAASHLTIEEAYEAVTSDARRAMGLAPAGPAEGAVADLLILEAPTLGEAMSGTPTGRTVIRRGREVARRSVRETDVLPPAQPNSAAASS